MKIFSKFKQLFSDYFGPGSTVYSILKPCYRCVYGKRYEPILIYSFNRGPRVIVNYKGTTFSRRGNCIGFKKCGSCLEVIEGKVKNRPCKWYKLGGK